jgi:hypothetical protein
MFSDTAARVFLSETTFDLLIKIRQEKDLAAAGIEHLERCP